MRRRAGGMRARWPRRAARFLGRLLTGVVAFVVFTTLSLLLVIQLLRLPPGRELVRKQALALARDFLPGLEVGRIGGDYLNGIVLYDVALDSRYGAKVLRLSRLELRYALLPLLDQRIEIEELVLVEPRVFVQPSAHGGLNVSHLLDPELLKDGEAPAGGPFAWTIQVGKVAIDSGYASIEPSRGAQRLKVKRLDLTARGKLAGEQLTARLSELDLVASGTLPDGRQVDVKASGTAAVEHGRVSSSKLTFRIDGLERGPRGAETILTAQAAGPLSKLEVEVDLDAARSGRAQLDGWLDLRAKRPAYALKLETTKLDPSLFHPAAPVGRLGLKLALNGRGVPPGSEARLEARLDLDATRLAGYAIEELRLRGTLNGERWRVKQLSGRGAGVRLRASGQGTFERVQATLELAAADLQRIPALPEGSVRGSVRLDARVQGKLRGPLSVRFDARASDVATGEVRVARLAAHGRFTGLPERPDGRMQLELQRVRLPVAGAARRVERVALEVAGDGRDVTVSLQARGPELAAKVALVGEIGRDLIRARLDELRLRYEDQTLSLLNQPVVSYHRARQEVELEQALIRALGGRIALSGAFRPRSWPRLAAQVELKGVQAARGPRLDGQAALQLDRQQGAVDLELSLAGVPGDLELEGVVPLRYAAGGWPSGIARAGALRLRARVPALELERVATWLPEGTLPQPLRRGQVGLRADLEGTAARPVGEIALTVNDFALEQLEGLEGVDARVDASAKLALGADETTLSLHLLREAEPLVDARATFGVAAGKLISVSPGDWVRRLRGVPLNIEATVTKAPAEPLARLAGLGRDVEGNVALRLNGEGTLLQPKLDARLELTELEVDVVALEVVTLELAAEATDKEIALDLELDEGGRTAVSAQANVGTSLRALLARGRLPDAPLSARLRVPSYPLNRLTRFDPLLPSTTGQVELEAAADGTLRSPKANAQLRADGLVLEQVNVGKLQADASYAPARGLDARLRLEQEDGGALGARIEWPPRKATAGGERGWAELDADRFRLRILGMLSPTLQSLRGKLDGMVRVRGPKARPELDGRLTLSGGALQLPQAPKLSRIGFTIDLAADVIRLTDLQARSGEGTIQGSGRIELEDLRPQRFNLALRADDFDASFGPLRNARFSGPLELSGAIQDGKLTGVAQIDEGAVTVPGFESQRELLPTALPDDLRIVDRAAEQRRMALGEQGPRSDTRALPLELAVKTTPLFVRGEQARLAIRTDLMVVLPRDAEEELQVRGTVQVQRGWIKIQDRRYEIREARVQFSGGELDPALNITLVRHFPEEGVDVIVEVRGTASAPDVDFRSDPPKLDKAQIVSMIVTGRPQPMGDGAGGDTGLLEAASTAVAQALVGGVLDKVADTVGLDVATFTLGEEETEAGRSALRAQTEIGKYLTERLYVGYRRTFGAEEDENTNAGLLEYYLAARWLFMASFGDAGVGGLDVFWTYRY